MTDARAGGRARTIAWFALAHFLIILVGFHFIYTSSYADYPIYREYGRRVLLGQLPYRDFPAEYPPFAFVFFTLPATVGFNTVGDYYVAWLVQVYVADVVALITLDGMARRHGASPTLVLGAYTALFAVVGPLTVHEFDLFPAVLTLLAISAFDAEKEVRGWLWLALGVMTKLYPLLLAPVILLRRNGRLSLKPVLKGALIGVGACLVLMFPWLATAPASLLVFLRYHAARGLQLESTYSSVVLGAKVLGLARAATENSFGAWNTTGAAAATAVRMSTWLLVAALIAAYAVCAVGFARRGAKNALADTNASLPACGAFVLLAAMVTSKVLSPQYLVWLLPMLALATGPGRVRRWALFAAIAITTYYIFPRHYNALIAIDSGMVVALLVRNLLLLSLTLMLALDILREPRVPRAEHVA